ncbi:MAG: hypothetical protein R3C01_00695 [Planctomycetaceae bacterium]
MDAPFPIRPLRIPDTLDAGLETLRRQFFKLLAIAAILFIPWSAWTNLVMVQYAEARQDPAQVFEVLVVVLPIQLGTLVTISPVYCAAMVRVLNASMLHRKPPSIWGAILFALSRGPAIIFASSIVMLAVFLGKMFFVLPGMFAEAAFLAVLPVLLLEQGNPLKAIGRAFELSIKHFPKAIVLTMVVWAVEFSLGAVKFLIPETHIQALLTSVVQSCAYMISMSLAVAFYLSSRAQSEHLDLDLMLLEIARNTEAPPDEPTGWSPSPL